MYKLVFCFMSFFLASNAKSQDVKVSFNLVGRNLIGYDNGYKRLATEDRGLTFEYEHKLKLYSWSYNFSVGNSRINFNRRIDSLSTDVYNSAYFLQFYPVGLKKYYRINARSSYYLEVMAGIDYLYKLSQKFEREELPSQKLKKQGFALGVSAKSAFKVMFNRRGAFDIGFHVTDNFLSRQYIDQAKKQKAKFQGASIFITFYQSLKYEKRPPRVIDFVE